MTEKGVEMVSVNLTFENKAEVEKAFQGAEYLFCVTVSSILHFKKDDPSRTARISGNIWM